MPTIVSYLKINAFRPKDSEEPGEGMDFNTLTRVWGEPNIMEKERLMGY